jgi:group I intron endonuclease
MNENYKVYMHTNKVNGKKYIGITGREVQERWKNGSGYKSGLFKQAIKKYGWDNFDHEIISSGLSLQEAKDMEIKYIKYYNSFSRGCGYNLTIGGDGIVNYKHTEESKKKISIASKNMSLETRRAARRKQIITEEHKKHISESRVGIKFSKEHLSNLSKSHMGKPCYWDGKKRPESTRKKIGEMLSKKVICTNTGVVYSSITEASKETGFCIASIHRWCNGVNSKITNLKFEYYQGGSD